MSELIIGNKNYSSWSLRPWLLLKEMEIEFTETRIPLYENSSKEKLLMYSPSGKVPVFVHGQLAIWDSLAICEFISEHYPEKNCWPMAMNDRAIARSISNEMHSGFQTIRNTLPMNCRMNRIFRPISETLQSEIDRVSEVWRNCRLSNSAKGDFLFGPFTIADAMFAPMVLRFSNYGIAVGSIENGYMETIRSLKNMQRWINDGLNEHEILPQFEIRV